MEDEPQASKDETSQSLEARRYSNKNIAIYIVTLLISLSFLNLAEPFLIALVLAGIFTELSRPLYLRLKHLVGGREGLASSLTLLTGLTIVILPLIVIALLAVSQASTVIDDTSDLMNVIVEDVEALKTGSLDFPDWVPFSAELEASGPQIYEKVYELTGKVASFLISSLSHITNGTASFFLGLFTFLYAMFFFLPMKRSIFDEVLSYSGLPLEMQNTFSNRIVSVSRATIKGSLVIGVIQGALGGFGFWMAGFDGAVFWAVIMAVLAAVPAVGATPVVICGAIYLLVEGQVAYGVALGLWGALVVGTIDNLLRPKLVGQEADMSDLWIFVSTLGGLAAFGASGLVIGPVIAGLFIATWEEVSRLGGTGTTDEQEPEESAIIEAENAKGDPETKQSGLKLTATKEELEAEVEALRRELQER